MQEKSEDYKAGKEGENLVSILGSKGIGFNNGAWIHLYCIIISMNVRISFNWSN